MDEKVLLILVDGMRPDSLRNIPLANELMKKSSYSMNVRTVMPSVTLPCHMSLFHSVDPQRHGIVTNIYTPQVRPVDGLCEQLAKAKKKSAFFYNWEELRDLARPGALAHACYLSGKAYTYRQTNSDLTKKAKVYIQTEHPDFVFLYLGDVDEVGHEFGWMSDDYMEAVAASWMCIEEIMSALPKGYTTIVTSDHGGHDRVHGTELAEDMTTPIFLYGAKFQAWRRLENVSIKDIAPTIAALIGCEPAPEWEGVSVVE